MKTLTSRLISTTLSFFLLSFVGCGDDDGGGGTASPTPTNSPPPASTSTPTATQQATPPNTPTATVQPTSTDTPAPTATATAGNELDISVCAPDAGPFSNQITNPFFPLPVGTQWILEGEEDGEELRVEITSLDETEVVAGIVTRVIEEREWEDDELVEVSRNFFVQTADGTVCYYGEDVDDYEDGEIVGHDGAWRAGVDDALPGILIPGDPQIGQSFRQEVAIGVAEDRAVQVAAGETVEVEYGTFTDTIRYEESSPLDSGTSEKIYARDVGLLVDDEIELVEVIMVTDSPQCFDTTLDAASCDPDVVEFTLGSTNPYYPLTVGLRTVLEGEEDGEQIRVERVVLADTEIVAGVETHVLEHKEFIDDEIHEIARNYYVEAGDGTVCYFGEDVEFYEDGVLVNMQGTWKAGVNGAKPGIIMPASPSVGDAYFQENAPGVAIDMGRVSDTGESRDIGGTSYDDLVVIQDSNPLEGCDVEEEKVYAPGIGEIVDDILEIVEVESAALD